MNRACPNCDRYDWGHVHVRGRKRAVCVACWQSWWVEDGSLVGETQILFAHE